MESRLRPRCLQMEYHMFLTHSNLLPQYRLANKKMRYRKFSTIDEHQRSLGALCTTETF